MSPILRTCRSCRAELSPEDRFCPGCGHETSAPGGATSSSTESQAPLWADAPRRSGRVWPMLAIAVLGIALGGIAYWAPWKRGGAIDSGGGGHPTPVVNQPAGGSVAPQPAAVFYRLELSVDPAGCGKIEILRPAAPPRAEGFEAGTEIALLAVPTPGWLFDGWRDGDASPEKRTWFVRPGENRVVARFRLAQPVAKPHAAASPRRPEADPTGAGENSAQANETTEADLTGTYVQREAGEHGGEVGTLLSISAQRGGQFLVGIATRTGNPQEDWEGRGTVAGAEGSYDWVFGDGRSGRTTFVIQDDGTLRGRVLGSGLDWEFVAERKEGPVRLPKKSAGDMAGPAATDSAEPQTAAKYCDRGAARIAVGDLNGAIADLSSAIRLDAQFSLAYQNRAVARQELGNLQAAIDDWTEALRIEPRGAGILSTRAAVYIQLGDLEHASADLNAAIEIDPAVASTWTLRAGLRYAQKDLAGALVDLDRALTLDADQPDVFVNRGIVHEAAGSVAEALEDYSKALELAPADWPRRAQTESRRAQLQAGIDGPK